MVLQKDEMLTASVDIEASPQRVHAIVSDISLIPQWSPEVIRTEKLTASTYQAWNRRRLGRWRTTARIVAAEEGHFSFVVEALGGDWTQWTFLVKPGDTDGVTRLTQQFRMCVAMPTTVLLFERLALFVFDRRSDLRANMATSVHRIKAIAESNRKESQ